MDRNGAGIRRPVGAGAPRDVVELAIAVLARDSERPDPYRRLPVDLHEAADAAVVEQDLGVVGAGRTATPGRRWRGRASGQQAEHIAEGMSMSRTARSTTISASRTRGGITPTRMRETQGRVCGSGQRAPMKLGDKLPHGGVEALDAPPLRIRPRRLGQAASSSPSRSSGDRLLHEHVTACAERRTRDISRWRRRRHRPPKRRPAAPARALAVVGVSGGAVALGDRGELIALVGDPDQLHSVDLARTGAHGSSPSGRHRARLREGSAACQRL